MSVVAFTAASLKGVSTKLASDFAMMYPGHKVVFNLDGTQALRTQVQNGAYADVFISLMIIFAVSSATSRTIDDARVSPHSSVPPGRHHVPVSARRTSSHRPSVV